MYNTIPIVGTIQYGSYIEVLLKINENKNTIIVAIISTINILNKPPYITLFY